MVFSSHVFMFCFLPLALALYYVLPRWGKHLALALLSYVFYGWANPLFVVVLLTSTVVDYFCGLVMTGQFGPPAWGKPVPILPPIGPGAHGSGRGKWYNWLLVPRIWSWVREETPSRRRSQKIALVVSICSNLSLLGFFKYFDFGVDSFNGIVKALGADHLVWGDFLRITLPLGISFYTFQSMSYSIDVYRGHARGIRNFIDFACYVSMFPQLVAGPIIRFHEIDQQLRSRSHTAEKFARGVTFVCMGLAKKILIANVCGKVADTVFDAGSVGLADSWYGVFAYSMQIYFDFSAYSDMAIGLGLMLGFVFPKNFDSPYVSGSITEFWQRWHISLSSWLRDYLYMPLGGNRGGNVRTYVNVAIVMLLGGLWHGAAWHFVIWGGVHGALLCLERFWGKKTFYDRLPRPARIVLTNLILLFTWPIFRADDLAASAGYYAGMLGLNGLKAAGGSALISGVIYQPLYVMMMIVAAVVVWTAPQTWTFTRRITWWKVAVVLVLLWLSLTALTTQSYNPFIYFIF